MTNNLARKRRDYLHLLKLCVQFYCGYAFASLLVTAACVSIYIHNGGSSLQETFGLKLTSLAAILTLTNGLSKKRFFFYYNQGATKNQLWTVSIFLDLIIYFLVMKITSVWYDL